jgi:Tol biopolymer transport system component
MSMNRRQFVAAASAAVFATRFGEHAAAAGRGRGVLLMQRVGPTESTLFSALADGSQERPLLAAPAFDYHATFAPRGDWLVFTSERRGRGQSDLYRADLDGSAIRALTADAAVEDAAAVAPDGRRIAFVSTRDDRYANIWTLDLASGRRTNLTGRHRRPADAGKPAGFYRPAWSPDGKWLACSSDRDTIWQGHLCGAEPSVSCSGPGNGWEHVQQLSIYVMPATGGALRRLATRPGFSMGSPRWSADGKRVVFYELSLLDTWNARIKFLSAHAVSQIVSLDVATGERMEHTTGPGLKLFQQFLPSQELAYQIRAGNEPGLYVGNGPPRVKGAVRSPAWSRDGARVVYEKTSANALPQNAPFYGWDPAYDYRSTESFPALSRDGKLAITEQSQNSSIAIMNPDGTGRTRVFDTEGKGLAFGPSWSPDGQWIYFGFGAWFERRARQPARIMRIRRDGTGLEALTDGAQNAGFPSCAPDGGQLVFRAWSDQGAGGLQILDLETRATRVLTGEYDNLPDWSPDGARIVFTRRLVDDNFDIFTIRPDGSDLRRLTTSGANDAHAVWTRDGRLLWTSGYYGFKDEAPLYEHNFQPYGQIWSMNADGSGKRVLTDSVWEEGEPMLLPS